MRTRLSKSRAFGTFHRLVTLVIGLAIAPSVQAETITLGGSGADLATMRLLGEAFQRTEPKVRFEILPNMGSSGGIKGVLAGKLDIGLSARDLKAEENRHGLRKLHYARTPLVFAVASNNPQTGIDRARLVQIYTGRNMRWDHGAPIRLVLRPETDSDTTTLAQGLPGITASLAEAYKRRGLPIAVTDQDAADAIESIPAAVSTSTLALMLAEKRKLKALSLDGIVPSPATLASGAYPLAKDLYFMLPVTPRPLVQRFIAFMQSRQGAAILEQTGHVVINPG